MDTGKPVMTLGDLKNMVNLMRKQSIPPCVVKTKNEARRLTRNDPSKHKWKVGEEYYTVEMLRRTMPIQAD